MGEIGACRMAEGSLRIWPQAWSVPPPISGAWKQSPVPKAHVHVRIWGEGRPPRNCLDIWGRRPSV